VEGRSSATPSSPRGLLPVPPVSMLRIASVCAAIGDCFGPLALRPSGRRSTRSTGAAPCHPSRVRASACSPRCSAASPWAVGGSLALCSGQHQMGRYAKLAAEPRSACREDERRCCCALKGMRHTATPGSTTRSRSRSLSRRAAPRRMHVCVRALFCVRGCIRYLCVR
jgi:hypothetical protein